MTEWTPRGWPACCEVTRCRRCGFRLSSGATPRAAAPSVLVDATLGRRYGTVWEPGCEAELHPSYPSCGLEPRISAICVWGTCNLYATEPQKKSEANGM